MRRRLTREWLSASLIGGSLFAVHQVLFFTSLKLTTVADVAPTPAPAPAAVSPEAQAFARLHRLSGQLNGTAMLAGVLLLAALGLRR